MSRFRREARVLASFQHPNVVTTFDAGWVANGRGFLVMELLRGVTLRYELAAKGPLPLSRISEILRGVCSAVGAAHQRSIVHRDLKPENVFLTEGGIVPKVLDFGLAALIDPNGSTVTLGQPPAPDSWSEPRVTSLQSDCMGSVEAKQATSGA